MSNNEQLIPHLFRTEYRKIVSVLCRHFGFREIEIAEDIASDTFLVAAQAWGIEGVPPNPVGWLYTTAKNKAKNHLHRTTIYEEKVLDELKATHTGEYEADIDLSPNNIEDSQLRMMFAICHPAISGEAQVGLALRILCGFGVQEIADAFMTGKDVINKRLTRAREKLREQQACLAMPDNATMDSRLEPVLTTIYLLFNEGYYSASNDQTIRREFCLEAVRLCTMLIENESTHKPPVNALMALMCFHASRFDARTGPAGALILYDEQDTGLWNHDLISKGGYFLQKAAVGDHLTRYHLEAGIAYWHTQKEDTAKKWVSILDYYDKLLEMAYSPAAALNRIYALSKVGGKGKAIFEAERLDLPDNHFYQALMGELHLGIDNVKALAYLQQALKLAKTEPERQMIRTRLHKALL